jgi:transcriptional regulator with XRE-family HTH domain
VKKRNVVKKKRTLIFDQAGLTAFALQLKKVRREQNITQEQLAFESGIALSQIARVETARINPTLSTVFAIAKAMNIPLSTLFDFSLH